MINRDATLFDIVEEYPETIPVFSSNGFPQMADAAKREKFAKTISLRSALLLKQLNLDSFSRLLEEAIVQNRNGADLTLNAPDSSAAGTNALHVVGLLPCPVRLPLMEKWNDFLSMRSRTYLYETVRC